MKRDETYVVDGDGPPQNGGNGTEFSLPQKLSGSLGCIESRSVVETPYVVFMRSQRGFELISPGGSIEFVGERIQRTARTYPTTVAAVYDADRDCVKFLVASATEPANGYVAGTAGGAILCFYAKSNAWSVHKVPVGAVADSVFSDMTIVDTGTERITVLFSADGRVFPEKTTAAYSSTLYQDPTSKPVVCKLATSWIKQNGAVNTRFRLYGAEMFALKQTLHTVIMKLYTNYSSSAQDNKTFNPPATSATPEILVIEPSIQQVYSAKLEVTYQEPDTGSVGTGEGTRVLQLAMSIGAQDGLPRVPAVQRK
jgi:hypothetical protein